VSGHTRAANGVQISRQRWDTPWPCWVNSRPAREVSTGTRGMLDAQSMRRGALPRMRACTRTSAASRACHAQFCRSPCCRGSRTAPDLPNCASGVGHDNIGPDAPNRTPACSGEAIASNQSRLWGQISQPNMDKEGKERGHGTTHLPDRRPHDIPHCIIRLRMLEAYHEQHEKGLLRAFSVVRSNTK
jgi:hypothetical protein